MNVGELKTLLLGVPDEAEITLGSNQNTESNEELRQAVIIEVYMEAAGNVFIGLDR